MAEKLYHYTSFEAACKIVASKTLLYGSLSTLNDLNESYRPLFYHSEEARIAVESELKRIGQVSFCTDKPLLGFDISAMWAHYAQTGYGVCLVFDKQELLRCAQSTCWKLGQVTYSEKYDADIIIPQGILPHEYFEKHFQPLLLTKTTDWQYEQEFRILCRKETEGEQKALSFDNALLAIILNRGRNIQPGNSVMGSSEYKALKQLSPNVPVVELGHFLEETNLSEQGEELFSTKKQYDYEKF